jgi:O-antigen/teichoic acid export membrane protein
MGKRLRIFAGGVAAGYAALAANAIYSFASIPLALYYLNDEQFGLWSLVMTICGYLSLIEFGLNSAFARLLIDRNDNSSNHAYGSLIKTLCLVQFAQGLIIAIIATFSGPLLAPVLKIAPALQMEFNRLIFLQGIILAFSFVTRIYSLLLYAHHRQDIANGVQAANFFICLGAQWLCFRDGLGTTSLVASNAVGALVLVGACAFAVHHLHLLPASGTWGKIIRHDFRALFSLGGNIFLITASTQILLGAPLIIVTHQLGLAAAAVWAVAMRAFTLVSQLCWRPFDTTFTHFSEMVAHGHHTKLRELFRTASLVTFGLCTVGAVGLAMSNRHLVSILSRGRFEWPAVNDALIAAWFLVLTITRCHSYLIQSTKEVHGLRNTYLAEAALFVALGAGLCAWLGGAGVLVASILSGFLCTAAYGTLWTSRFLGVSWREIALRWPAQAALFALPLIATGLAANILCPAWSAAARLLFTAAAVAIPGLLLFPRLALPLATRESLLSRIPIRWRGTFARLAGLRIAE